MLKKFYQLMMDNKDELAKMITAENVSKQTDKGYTVKCLNIQTPDACGNYQGPVVQSIVSLSTC